MVHKFDKVTLFKLIVKIAFFGALAAFFIYSALNIKRRDQSSIIDTSITYTTTSFTTTTSPLNINPAPQEIVDSIPKYVTTPEEGLDWKIFANTKSSPYTYIDDEGQEQQGVKPEFSEELQKHDGQIITMQGYMFPLNAEEKQSMFIFGPFPISCPFHYHVGPALVIETHAKEKVEFKFDPITLRGKLELIPQDNDYNVFYRLQETELVE